MTGLVDPLHSESGPDIVWTTVNAEEAVPGVPTPLGWTFWGVPLERSARRGFADLGILSRLEGRTMGDLRAAGSRPFDGPIIAIFHGRTAGSLTFLRAFADRMPGTSGDALERQFFGERAEGRGSRSTRRRYPWLVIGLPRMAATIARRTYRTSREHQAWWEAVSKLEPGSTAEATAMLRDARTRFEHAIQEHSRASMLAQGLFDQVGQLAAAGGRPGLELILTAGHGTIETGLAEDLWEVSRGRCTMEQFLDRHGFHGPNEGEISNPSWREDDAPLRSLVHTYGQMGEDQAPRNRAEERRSAEVSFLAGLAPLQRARARMTIRVAAHFIPLREVGKSAFLQAIDVGRSAARALGAHLVREGALDHPDDVFYLTFDELTAGPPPVDAREQVAYRRARRQEHLGRRLPERWVGQPEAIALDTDERPTLDADLVGIGASAGVVEGTARVVLDPSDLDFDEGEILVCERTDPSWAPAFVVAAAVVIDVGGSMSHGAIVAREMGIPCVINTRTGTQRVRTGDRLRVDGTAGTVSVLARVGDGE